MVLICKACVASRELQGEEQLLRQLRNLQPREGGTGWKITQLSLFSTLLPCIFTSILDCQPQALGGQRTYHPPYTASTALDIYWAVTVMEDGKAFAYNTRDRGSIPGSGSSPGEGSGTPLQYSCLENPFIMFYSSVYTGLSFLHVNLFLSILLFLLQWWMNLFP